jgi:hypothetical protein
MVLKVDWGKKKSGSTDDGVKSNLKKVEES